MRNTFLKQFNRLLVFLAGALGFAGCDHPNWPAYGCPPEPYNILNISGFVVDENGDPIKDKKSLMPKSKVRRIPIPS